jgi:hypothetical protein
LVCIRSNTVGGNNDLEKVEVRSSPTLPALGHWYSLLSWYGCSSQRQATSGEPERVSAMDSLRPVRSSMVERPHKTLS